MTRPPLAPVAVPRRLPDGLPPALAGWAADINQALKALSAEIAGHAAAVHQLAEGQTVLAGTVTLRTSPATTTVVSKEEIPAGGQPFLSPRTASAAAEIGAGTLQVSAAAKGGFTVTHASSASADRVFGWKVEVPA